jgi:hypothetical protein
MKLLLYAALCSILISYGCDRSHEFLDPSKEKRLSVEFLIPPSIGSPYKVGDPVLINVVITANNDSVRHVDVAFMDGNTVLTTIGVDNPKPNSILNDKLWNVQYFVGVMHVIPPAWSNKQITVQATANNVSAIGKLVVN